MVNNEKDKSLFRGIRSPPVFSIGIVLTMNGILNVFERITIDVSTVSTYILFAMMLGFIGMIFVGFGLQWIITDAITNSQLE